MHGIVVDPVQTGKNIKNIYIRNNDKVVDIARYMGFSDVRAVYKWLKGESVPALENIIALMKRYNVDFNKIISYKDSFNENDDINEI